MPQTQKQEGEDLGLFAYLHREPGSQKALSIGEVKKCHRDKAGGREQGEGKKKEDSGGNRK